MRIRAAISVLFLAFAAACGDHTPLEPAIPFAPSFEIVIEQLVVQGPFSLRDRVGADFTPFDLNDRGDIVGLAPTLLPGIFHILPGDGGPLVPAPTVVVESGALATPALTAINELGAAAGLVIDVSPAGAPRTRPVLWTPGSDPQLGPFVPGIAAPEAPFGNVFDVSDLGTIVGSFGDDLVTQFPLRWTAGAAAVEILDASTADDGFAVAINSAGVAVGELTGATLPMPGRNGAIWSADGSLTFLPGADRLVDINESGQIAGTQQPGLCPTMWDANLSVLFEAPCGTTGEVGARALNDMGHFLYRGATTSDPTIGDRLWIEGFEPLTLQPLATAGVTAARKVNNRGMILGVAFAADLSAPEAVIWTYRLESVSPSEMLENVAEAIDDLAADGTLGPSAALALGTKVDAANHQLAHGHCAAAVSLLETVILLIDAAERTGQLSAEQAAELRDAVNAAIAGIEAGCVEG